MNKILDGKPVYNQLKNKILEDVKFLKSKSISPCLAVISFSSKPDSQGYLRTREKLAKELNIKLEVINFTKVPTNDELIKKIKILNSNKKVHGIIIDRPLPKSLNEREIYLSLDPLKDVDGCHPLSSGNLMQGFPGYIANTSAAVMEIIKFYKIKLEGLDAVVIGRSKNVGLPMFPLLVKENATVTICHSKTKQLETKAKQAQLIVVAVGIPNFVNSKFINKNTILIDVGTNYTKDNKVVGDADPSIYKKIKAYTPVPGGVGPVTNIILFKSLIQGLVSKYAK